MGMVCDGAEMGIEGRGQDRSSFRDILSLAEAEGAAMDGDVVGKVRVSPRGLVEVYLGLLARLGEDLSRNIGEDAITAESWSASRAPLNG